MKTHLFNLTQAVHENDIGTVKASLSEIGQEEINRFIQIAAQKGHLRIVKLLLPLSDNGTDHKKALYWAAFLGHLEMFKLLLPVSTISSGKGSTFSNAAIGGNLDIFQILLPLSDPQADDFDALALAARHGRTEIVKLLLPFGHPKDSRDLLYATVNDYFPIIDMLYPRDNVQDVILKAQNYCSGEERGVFYLNQRWQADQTKTLLNENIQIDNRPTLRGKKM